MEVVKMQQICGPHIFMGVTCVTSHYDVNHHDYRNPNIDYLLYIDRFMALQMSSCT